MRILLIIITFFPILMNAQNKRSEIIFLNNPNQELIDWGNQWSRDEVFLSPCIGNSNGAYLVDENSAFIYGSLGTAAASIQTILLRTTDSGITWQEVMTPMIGSEIVHLQFSEMGKGYALVDWATESGGEQFTLFFSDDLGINWKKLSEIKKPHYSCELIKFDISEPTFGMYLSCDANATGYERYQVYSGDGGSFWESIPLLEILDSVSSQPPIQEYRKPNSFGYIMLVPDPDNEMDYQVWKHDVVSQDSTLFSTIPGKYNWKNGKLEAAK